MMESDKELLELAAKAAGYGKVEYVDGAIGYKDERGKWRMWYPLTDDGDALRLAAELNITIIGVISISNEDFAVAEYCHQEYLERITNCKMTAIRRAIVRAAAEIGKAMP